MPGCRGEMVDWWFGYLDSSEKFRMWFPESHIHWEWVEPWRRGHYRGASSLAERTISGRLQKARIHFHDPSEFMDTARFPEAHVGAAICANVYDLEKIPLYRFIHLVRDTRSGCEMRSRFWLFNGSDADAAITMGYCIDVMGRLADLLPGLYERENSEDTQRFVRQIP
jgi:hypothetical protein